jgi:hypothetical protein
MDIFCMKLAISVKKFFHCRNNIPISS